MSTTSAPAASSKRPSTRASAAPSRTIVRVGPLAAEQRERAGDQRLARAGLAADRGETRPHEQVDLLDDPEVLDAQLRSMDIG